MKQNERRLNRMVNLKILEAVEVETEAGTETEYHMHHQRCRRRDLPAGAVHVTGASNTYLLDKIRLDRRRTEGITAIDLDNFITSNVMERAMHNLKTSSVLTDNRRTIIYVGLGILAIIFAYPLFS